MSDFFELFNPGLRHTREQRDFEKILVVDHKKGGWGPRPLDLESGRVVLYMPGSPAGPAVEPAPIAASPASATSPSSAGS